MTTRLDEIKQIYPAKDEIKGELARNRRCSNFGMLHSYSTVIGTEKSRWVPFSGYG